MPDFPTPALAPARALVVVKTVHTIAWAFFVTCIVALPLAVWAGEHRLAVWLAGIVGLESAVLVANRWRCPLTAVAARYTEDRRPNFDIYLPLWLAKHNKLIFGALYVLGLGYAVWHWMNLPR